MTLKKNHILKYTFAEPATVLTSKICSLSILFSLMFYETLFSSRTRRMLRQTRFYVDFNACETRCTHYGPQAWSGHKDHSMTVDSTKNFYLDTCLKVSTLKIKITRIKAKHGQNFTLKNHLYKMVWWSVLCVSWPGWTPQSFNQTLQVLLWRCITYVSNICNQ